MRSKTTKDRSTKQEKEVASELGGRTQIASGALWIAKADVRTDKFLIECKTTRNNRYILTRSTWDKIRKESISDKMRMPMMVIDLAEDSNDSRRVVVVSYSDFSQYNLLERSKPVMTLKKSHYIQLSFLEKNPSGYKLVFMENDDNEFVGALYVLDYDMFIGLCRQDGII